MVWSAFFCAPTLAGIMGTIAEGILRAPMFRDRKGLQGCFEIGARQLRSSSMPLLLLQLAGLYFGQTDQFLHVRFFAIVATDRRIQTPSYAGLGQRAGHIVG